MEEVKQERPRRKYSVGFIAAGLIFTIMLCCGILIAAMPNNVMLIAHPIPIMYWIGAILALFFSIFGLVRTFASKNGVPIHLYSLIFICLYLKEFVMTLGNAFSNYNFYLTGAFFSLFIVSSIVFLVGRHEQNRTRILTGYNMFIAALVVMFLYIVISFVLTLVNYNDVSNAFWSAYELIIPEEFSSAIDYFWVMSFVTPIISIFLVIFYACGLITPMLSVDEYVYKTKK